MRKIAIALLSVILMLINPAPFAYASLNAPINLDNPRVGPLLGSASEDGPAFGFCSGFLYSPRIVFTAAHCIYMIESNGQLTLRLPPVFKVGKPNSSTKDPIGRVKVVKNFVADYKKSRLGGDINDFVVLVLEKDLAPVAPAKLVTPEIEQELAAINAKVIVHGYGEYRDRCDPGEALPCKQDWRNPNKSPSELPRSLGEVSQMGLKSFFTWLTPDHFDAFANHTLLTESPACTGDSGGPTTVMYKGEAIYLGPTPNGANVFACGAGNKQNAPDAFSNLSPIHRHLDLIKTAETFIAGQFPAPTKKTIVCKKGSVIKKIKGTKCPAGFAKK